MTTALDRVRTAMTLDDRLDDITQAHVWSRIEDAVGTPRRSAGRIMPILGALAAAAVVVILATRRNDVTDELSAPANTTLSAHLGPHTRAELIGPARVEIVGAAGDTTRIRLRTGTLVAEFTGGTGRSLAIDAPGATIEIVGTVFAVEVVGDGSCVSVSHGTVRVRPSRGGEQRVTTGERWCTAESRIGPIPPPLRDVLEQHAVHTASRELAAPPPAVAAPPEVSSPASPPVASPPITSPPVGLSDAAPGPTSPAAPHGSSHESVAATQGSSHDAAPTGVATTHDTAPTRVAATQGPSHDATTSVAAPRGSSHYTPPTITSHDAAPTSSAAAHESNPTDIATHDAAPTNVAAVAPTTIGAHDPSSASHDAAVVMHDAAPRPTGTTPPSPTSASMSTAPGMTPPRQAEPAVVPKPAPTGPELAYDTAERALAKHDLAAADRALAQITEGPLLGQALYERARIAYQQHAWGRAQRQLDRLAALGASPLTEPGAYLACRIALAAGDDGAERCFVEYRTAYPHSPHDLDVLGVLADLAYRAGGCVRAVAIRDELVRRYPQSALARGWVERCKEAR